MKSTLRVFAVLDIISIFLISAQVFDFSRDHSWFNAGALTVFKVILFIFLYISLFFSAYWQLKLAKKGLITYYFQFIPRIISWIYSIGFLTLIGDYFSNSQVAFEWLFRLIVMFEFLRIYLSIRIHKKYLL